MSDNDHAGVQKARSAPSTREIIDRFTDTLVQFTHLLQNVALKQDLTYGRMTQMAEAVDRLNNDLAEIATDVGTIAQMLKDAAANSGDAAVEAALSPIADKADAAAAALHALVTPPAPATSSDPSSGTSASGSAGSASGSPTSGSSGTSSAGS